MKKKLFYSLTSKDFRIECFKLLDRDESIEPGYEIISTNLKSGETATVEGYTPQSCIALADMTMEGFNV